MQNLNLTSNKQLGLGKLALAACLFFGGIYTAQANLTLINTYKNTPENTPHILSTAGGFLGDPSVDNLLRLENFGAPPADSPFSVTYQNDKTALVSWNLAGTGSTLEGIYVFGGSNGANLYQVTDAAQMISGSATVNAPLTGKSGGFADISHMLFLGTQGTAVPEPSTLAALIGGAASLVGAQRLFRRRS